MSHLLPHRPSVKHSPRSQQAIGLTDKGTGEILAALQSDTARQIVAALGESPATATDLAGLTDTSPQNVHHHLKRLSAAGIVDQVDTWYSERGVEMTVYDLVTDHLSIDLAPTSSPDSPKALQVSGHE